jgi:hypothetical protein
VHRAWNERTTGELHWKIQFIGHATDAPANYFLVPFARAQRPPTTEFASYEVSRCNPTGFKKASLIFP